MNNGTIWVSLLRKQILHWLATGKLSAATLIATGALTLGGGAALNSHGDRDGHGWACRSEVMTTHPQLVILNPPVPPSSQAIVSPIPSHVTIVGRMMSLPPQENGSLKVVVSDPPSAGSTSVSWYIYSAPAFTGRHCDGD